jgi:hypothetical protein
VNGEEVGDGGEKILGDLNLYDDMQSFVVWMITTWIAKRGRLGRRERRLGAERGIYVGPTGQNLRMRRAK